MVGEIVELEGSRLVVGEIVELKSGCQVPEDFATIQQALDALPPEGRLTLAPGTCSTCTPESACGQRNAFFGRWRV